VKAKATEAHLWTPQEPYNTSQTSPYFPGLLVKNMLET